MRTRGQHESEKSEDPAPYLGVLSTGIPGKVNISLLRKRTDGFVSVCEHLDTGRQRLQWDDSCRLLDSRQCRLTVLCGRWADPLRMTGLGREADLRYNRSTPCRFGFAFDKTETF